jgi:protein-S-isoprenylcysteine O-methyltransferase Ste14
VPVTPAAGVYTAAMEAPSTPPGARRLIRGIMLAVLVWGVVLAIGAWRLNNDPRRLLVVLACVVAFLGFWLAMLGLRARHVASASSRAARRSSVLETSTRNSRGETK